MKLLLEMLSWPGLALRTCDLLFCDRPFVQRKPCDTVEGKERGQLGVPAVEAPHGDRRNERVGPNSATQRGKGSHDDRYTVGATVSDLRALTVMHLRRLIAQM